MKNHPVKRWSGWAGFNQTDPATRLKEKELVECLNARCEPTGRIVKHYGYYPVTMADDFGVSELTGRVKNHSGARFRGPTGNQRALAVAGSAIKRSGPNNLYDVWPDITFPVDYETPNLDLPAAIVFKDRYAYHQNGEDYPFRVEMEAADGSTGSYEAEVLGLFQPITAPYNGSQTAGTRFPAYTITNWCYTFVYGDRGESGPSQRCYLNNNLSTDNYDTVTMTIPTGPSGVTARRIYRTQIGHGQTRTTSAWTPLNTAIEFFLLAEIGDNSTTTFTDSRDDAALDYSKRLPPQRPFPPRAKYQVVHQNRFAWANLRDNPFILGIREDPTVGATSASVTVSNTGNGTITLTSSAGNITVNNYKTQTLEQILRTIVTGWNTFVNAGTTGGDMTTSNFIAQPQFGIALDRTYRFHEITSQSCFGSSNVVWLQAIDDDTDAVSVDGCEFFPNRLMWSNALYPEEINPLNVFDLSKDDAYPVHGLFRNDFTLGTMTSEHIWLLTGSLSADPDTFKPDFSIAATNSEAGNFCTRPDSIAVAPEGVYFIAEDGLRLYAGGRSKRIARGIDTRLLSRIVTEPRCRDNVCLYYSRGKLYIAFPGMEVA